MNSLKTERVASALILLFRSGVEVEANDRGWPHRRDMGCDPICQRMTCLLLMLLTAASNPTSMSGFSLCRAASISRKPADMPQLCMYGKPGNTHTLLH